MSEPIEKYKCESCNYQWGINYATFDKPSCPICDDYLDVIEITDTSREVVEGDKILIKPKNGEEKVAKCTGVTHDDLIHFMYWDERDTPIAGMIGRNFVQKLSE